MTCRTCLGTGHTPLYEPCAGCGGMGVEGAQLWRHVGLIYLALVGAGVLAALVTRC